MHDQRVSNHTMGGFLQCAQYISAVRLLGVLTSKLHVDFSGGGLRSQCVRQGAPLDTASRAFSRTWDFRFAGTPARALGS